MKNKRRWVKSKLLAVCMATVLAFGYAAPAAALESTQQEDSVTAVEATQQGGLPSSEQSQEANSVNKAPESEQTPVEGSEQSAVSEGTQSEEEGTEAQKEDIQMEIPEETSEPATEEAAEPAESMVFSTRTSAGDATVSLRNPDDMYYGITVNQIDVATLEDEGYRLAFQVGINMRDYYDEYIKPLVDSGWSSNASKFTVTFPAEMFDSNLEIDWSAVESPKTGPVEIQTANATDGVVLCGKNTSNTSSGYFSQYFVYFRVPAKLTADKYDAVSEKQSIDLDGTVTASVAESGLSDLEFAASYSIPVMNSEKSSLQVTSSDGSDVPFENGSWQLGDGTYNVSGTAQDYEGITVSGNATINLNGATILHTTTMQEKYAPAITIASGNASIVLNEESTVEGSNGYAGIYVAPSASLTISGSGVLNAKGGDGLEPYNLPANLQAESQKRGYVGGGAGIGGNGLLLYVNDTTSILGLVNCFGNITINGGTINATGGGTPYRNVGAGAGIGAGGTSSREGIDRVSSGNVFINDGTIKAIGGEGEPSSLTGGGAGIGAGGSAGNVTMPYNNNVKVSINGGIVNASGTADGAGIGGGSCVDSGIIEITGGTIKAIGGYEIEDGAQYEAYGGAGIGGGDMAGVTSITITGGTIYAKAVGCAAGIGGGNDGKVAIVVDYANDIYEYKDIRIGGNANVTAIGGADPNKTFGGAGIGAGESYWLDNGFGSVSITDSAKVKAYAGPNAQAIGVGSNYAGTEAPNKFSVESENVDVWLFNQDTTQGAFWGQNETGNALTADCSSEGVTAIWYTMPDGGAFPGENTDTAAFTNSDQEFSWSYAGNTLNISSNFGLSIEEDFEGTLGNWATFAKITTSYTVEYLDVDGNEIQAASSRTATIGQEVSVTDADKIIEGYTFDENNANNCLTATAADDGSTVLTLYFTKNVTPTDPTNPSDPTNPTDSTGSVDNSNGSSQDNVQNDSSNANSEAGFAKTGDQLGVLVVGLMLIALLCVAIAILAKRRINKAL